MSFSVRSLTAEAQQDECRLFVTYDEAIEILTLFFFIAA
jgi:hypothetical protein